VACSDPTITIINHQIMAGKYGAITRWMFGENITVEEYVGLPIELEPAHRKAQEEILANRPVEVVELNRAQACNVR